MDSIPIDAIQRFAGDDYTRARYYDFDPDFLIGMEPHARHYNLYTATTPDHPRQEQSHNRRILGAERLPDLQHAGLFNSNWIRLVVW